MPGEAIALFDATGLAIVSAGTLIATLARCGSRDLLAALAATALLLRPRFNEEANRAALARNAREIERSGPLAANRELPPDRALAAIIAAFLRSGSAKAFASARRADRAMRENKRMRAVRTFEYAAEIAPVFGLVGTLYAITGLSPVAGTSMAQATMAAMSTAVLSSLYGVLLAHLVCIPLAFAIDRRAGREDEAREGLADWFELQIRSGESGPAPSVHIRKVA